MSTASHTSDHSNHIHMIGGEEKCTNIQGNKGGKNEDADSFSHNTSHSKFLYQISNSQVELLLRNI